MYSAYKIEIHENHELFSYFDSLCFQAKNLYNTTNFYYRQVFTAMRNRTSNANQQEVMDAITYHLPLMNAIKQANFEKRKAKSPDDESVKLHLFTPPSEVKKTLGYGLLDGLFKAMKQSDYRALPAQTNQHVIKKVLEDWSSFYKAIKDYSMHPEKYTGRPKIPRYKKKDGRTVCILTNQTARIIPNHTLKLPKTKKRLNIGKLADTKGRLQQVRIVPFYGRYVVELIFKKTDEKALVRPKDNKNDFLFAPKRIMGVDIGVDNLAAIADNTGGQPVIVKGKVLKSINHRYNKERAGMVRILRNGLQEKEGQYISRKLINLDRKRAYRVTDYMHKASRAIVNIAIERGIDTIIIGKSDKWKEKVKMRKADKQTFIQLPFMKLIAMITYKAESVGIQVVTREESYTSKACFLSLDPIPVYSGEKNKFIFSGKRICRAFYRVKGTNIQINADVNAAFNILRKHCGINNPFGTLGRKDFLLSPKRVRIQ